MVGGFISSDGVSPLTLMLTLSPDQEKVETIEEETIEDLVQRNYTETVDEIEKDNFMFSLGKSCSSSHQFLILLSLQIC